MIDRFEMAWHGCRRLHDKAIVVAGASSGIGRASALRLAGEGARLVVGSPALEADKIETLVAEIQAAGGQAVGASFDATSDESAKALIELLRAAKSGAQLPGENPRIELAPSAGQS